MPRVNDIINQEIQAYLNQQPNYHQLRTQCVTVAPVDPIITAVKARLDQETARQVETITTQLTHDMHERQINQDTVEQRMDLANADIYRREKRELENWIYELGIQRASLAMIPVAFRRDRVRDRGFIDSRNKHEIIRINDRILGAESRIRILSDQLGAIEQRTRERDRRSDAPRLSNRALSQENQRQLNQDIRIACDKINDDNHQMKTDATCLCHQLFLQQLDQWLQNRAESARLSPSEKTALALIIQKMHIHLHDLTNQHQAEQALAQAQASLRTYETERRTQINRGGSLQITNSTLADDNVRLNANLVTLQSRYAELFTQWKRVGLAALVIAPSVTALIVTLNILLPSLAILVVGSIIGAAVLGLVIAAIVIAIQTALKHSEVNVCEETILSNTRQIADNRVAIEQLQQTNVPNLESNIQQIQTIVIPHKMQETEQATQIARASLQDALDITPHEPRFGNNSYGLFAQPSAPGLDEIPVAQEIFYGQSVSHVS
jgi:hypothetical protein